MQHLDSEELKRVWRDILADTPPQERLEGLSAEERLKGLSAEELLKGLSREELERLRQLLQEQAKANDSAPPSNESNWH
jgi:hypothetical protein